MIFIAIAFAGCAVDQDAVIHTSVFRDFVLSPEQRTNARERVTLVSISRSGRVVIRDGGILYSARVGEYFFESAGGRTDYTLKSVDLNTGRVVLTGETRIYGDPSAPMMIAR